MSIKTKYFISQYLQEEYNHGGIGCVDAERIFQQQGFEPLTFPSHYSFSIAAKWKRLTYLAKTFFSVKRNSVVIFVYPFYATLDKVLVRWLLTKAGVKVICFIVDIDGIKDGDDRKLDNEISFFRKLQYFIVLNDSMKQWLDQKVPGSQSTKIDFHSFLTAPVTTVREKSFTIVFAGNLTKSLFLKDIHLINTGASPLHFNLYGPGASSVILGQSNVSGMGVEKPYELPAKLQGSFGLVWDGDSIDKPMGSLGHYMQYISHHKLSLYILSGLPLIVPASAASAPLVEKYGIGFTINNLHEIESKIACLSAVDYHQMQTSMQPLALKISKGEYLSNAINALLKSM